MAEQNKIKFIIKRDGRVVKYDRSKITNAIVAAMTAIDQVDAVVAENVAREVEEMILAQYGEISPSVEQIQDLVQKVLISNNHSDVASEYIAYRTRRSMAREMETSLMKTLRELNEADSKNSDLKRENGNIDGDSAMGTMLRFGSEAAKDYYTKFVLPEKQALAYRNGDIHIHDFDFYTLTETCCQIDIIKLFKDGFGTGHGFIREPNDIRTYCALVCIAIQSNQNDQHGGQSIPNFDYGVALGVVKTYKKLYYKNFFKAYELLVGGDQKEDEIKYIFKNLEVSKNLYPTIDANPEFDKAEKELFESICGDSLDKIKAFASKKAFEETDEATFQGMEALIHNLNTMHSRAGAQVPFSSLNFGTDTSSEGRMVTKNFLLALSKGMGDGETAIFPISIFKVKEGINYNPEDPNYDLFKLAIKVSAKRLFPNFSFIDAPFNIKYYKEGHPETECAYMGCRTRVLANVYDPSREISYGRGNLSFTSINLPRLGIEAKGDLDKFFHDLTDRMDLVTEQLLDRLSLQSAKRVKNYPFLMGQKVWLDSDKLSYNDNIAEVLKHGTITYGFIGLAECLKALIGKHHGESEEAWKLGYKIIKFMREYADKMAEKYKLNFSLIATPAEGLSGRFTRLDKKRYGIIPGVTDREYYTNSFHIPVYHPITAFEKIELEAPFHDLTNGGHITYVELDGDTAKNIDAFEQIIRKMKESGIGYGSINHPVDRDPLCGYNGIINDECPKCGRKEHEGNCGFERIRRITGYLVGTLDRFNDGKRAEERDRVKHSVCPKNNN